MAFTTLPTYSTGDSVTAASWNTYIKNNFAAMPPDVFTATGQLFVGEGADAGGLLSPGGSGFLIVDAAEPLGVRFSDTFGSWLSFGEYTHSDYNNDTFGGTTVTINVHDATGFNVPAGAIMLTARLDVFWNAGSTDDYVSITNSNDTDMEMLRIDYNQLATFKWLTQCGLVVPGTGNIILEITDSSDVYLTLKFEGYTTT